METKDIQEQVQEIQKANEVLLKKRMEIKQKRENTLELVKSCLQSDLVKAIASAKELQETEYWPEAIKILEQQNKPIVKCSVCENNLPIRFHTKELKYITTACPICFEKIAQEKKKDEKRQIKSNFIKRLDSLLVVRGMPVRFAVGKPDAGIKPATIDTIPQSYRSLVKLNSGKGLFLTGSRGTGKTHLSCVIMRDICENLEPQENENGKYAINERSLPLFVTAPMLLMEIRDCFRDDSKKTEQEIIIKYSSSPVLILDDLGAEKTSDFVMEALYKIINRRYENVLQTIITSNLTLDELSEKLGDRITSRIAEMCDVKVMAGRDRRLGN